MGKLALVTLGLALASPLLGQLNCSTVNSGPACGTTMAGSFSPLGNHQRINLHMTGGFTDSVHGMLVIGLTNPAIPIPGTPCLLNTDWYASHGVAFMNGQATIFHSWPNEWIGTLRFQVFAFRLSTQGLELRASNAVAATCLSP
jgi:hypothetical protein